MSLARKLLLAMFIVSLTGTAFGAGTFASFTATTSNATSTFATGSIVLTDTVNSGNICYSTGTTATGPASSNTDTNLNATCDDIVNVTATLPGAISTNTVAIKNAGNLNAASLTLAGSPACASSTASGATFTGTGDLCKAMQFSVAVSGGACKYGRNASAVVIGTQAMTFPFTVTASSNDQFKLQVDGGTATDVTIANATYSTAALFTTALQNGITTAGLSATAMVGQDSIVYLSTNSALNTSSSLTVTTPTTAGRSILGVTATNMKISTGATHTGTNSGGCTQDAVHTLAAFSGVYGTAATGLNLGALNSNATNTYTVVVSFPSAAGNSFQGRVADFGHTWTAQ